jgi:polyisoprenoid-binding protein YceI
MRLSILPLTTAFLAFSACSQASEPMPKLTAEPISSSVQNIENIGNWRVIENDSHVRFTASQQGTEFTGEFGRFYAIINFNEDAVEKASLTATIDLGSVSAGDKDRDGALPGKEWFDVKSFPKAVFQSDNFAKMGDNTYEARGTLSMKGKSHPLTLTFTLDIIGTKAEMRGSITLDRTLWEVGTGAWSTDEWVSTNVTVDVKISAESSL